MDAFLMAKFPVVFFAVDTVCFEYLSQLSEYSGLPTQSESYTDIYLADKAVDGYLEEDRGEDTCSITLANPHIRTAWWKFTLKRMANVAFLKIFFRGSTVNRHVGFSVFVFNDSSYTPASDSGDKVYTHDPSTCLHQEMNITVNKVTQGITLYNSKDPPVNTSCPRHEKAFATIEICEVFVMGCPLQNYGEDCRLCNLRCRDQLCDALNGTCIYGCNNTFMMSSDCSCVTGHYGIICEKICGKCVTGTYCDQYTGICPRGCVENWQGPKCDECQDHKYGPNCAFDCGHCKNSAPCSKIDGTCGNGCEFGWSGSFCMKNNWILKTPSAITLAGSILFVVTLASMGIRFVYKRGKKNYIRKHTDESKRKSVSNQETMYYICGQTDVTDDKHYYNDMKYTSQDYTNDNMPIYENTCA